MAYFCFAMHLETDQENNGSVNFHKAMVCQYCRKSFEAGLNDSSFVLTPNMKRT